MADFAMLARTLGDLKSKGREAGQRVIALRLLACVYFFFFSFHHF